MKNYIKKDYSQHGEGKWLYDHIGNKITNGFFVDIGAHDGITNSNSNIFGQSGWKILYFEPNPITFSRLVTNTIKFNREIYNVAISNSMGFSNFEIVTKANYEGHSKLNSKGSHKVLTMPLSHFIDKTPDIVSIDAEGHDTFILNNILSCGIRPKFIIIEGNTKEEMKKQHLLLFKDYKLLKTFKVNNLWEIL